LLESFSGFLNHVNGTVVSFGLALGLSLWLFSPKPFEGFFWGHEMEAKNTWLFAPQTQYYGSGGSGSFTLNQDTYTGYQWAFGSNLLGIKLYTSDYRSIHAFSTTIGRAW
jgi:hypothetical protein